MAAVLKPGQQYDSPQALSAVKKARQDAAQSYPDQLDWHIQVVSTDARRELSDVYQDLEIHVRRLVAPRF